MYCRCIDGDPMGTISGQNRPESCFKWRWIHGNRGWHDVSATVRWLCFQFEWFLLLHNNNVGYYSIPEMKRRPTPLLKR